MLWSEPDGDRPRGTVVNDHTAHTFASMPGMLDLSRDEKATDRRGLWGQNLSRPKRWDGFASSQICVSLQVKRTLLLKSSADTAFGLLLAVAERAHFAVNGSEATQDNQGWIVLKPGLKIILR